LHEFFALPQDVKEQAANKETNRGYTSWREETLDPEKQSVGDTKEGYYICRNVESDHPDAGKPLHGPNVWPEESALPGWKDNMNEYKDMASAVGMQLLRLIAIALDMPPHYFDKDFTEPMVALRLLHYEATKSEPEKGVFAGGAHSDYGMLTLLLTD
jgi:isopenicillin N synthase-like dioxygenase